MGIVPFHRQWANATASVPPCRPGTRPSSRRESLAVGQGQHIRLRRANKPLPVRIIFVCSYFVVKRIVEALALVWTFALLSEYLFHILEAVIQIVRSPQLGVDLVNPALGTNRSPKGRITTETQLDKILAKKPVLS